MQNLEKNRILWLIISILTLIVSLIGVINPMIYDHLVSKKILSAVFSQDLISIVAASTVLIWAVQIKQTDYYKQIIIIGLLIYFFYAYGIYVIEQIYTLYYLFYMAIFTLSFYTIIYNIISIPKELLETIKIDKKIRYLAVIFSLIIPLMFYSLWISQIIPLIQEREKLDYLFSIYILDLCFIMPLFIIIAYMAAKEQGLGLILIPAVFIMGFILLFSVGLGALIAGIMDEVLMYLSISLLFLIIALLYLKELNMPEKEE